VNKLVNRGGHKECASKKKEGRRGGLESMVGGKGGVGKKKGG